MGLFDSVYVACPNCKKDVEFQTKDDDSYCRNFTLETAPAHILCDIMNEPVYCKNCSSWVALIDPQYPPGEKPKPNLSAALVKAPDKPMTHHQGLRWWPDDKPFTYDDLMNSPKSP